MFGSRVRGVAGSKSGYPEATSRSNRLWLPLVTSDRRTREPPNPRIVISKE